MGITAKYEIAVVGGGAAGLMAAGEAAKLLGGGKVALLEAIPRVGKKLLATDNGRCNITNLSAAWPMYHSDAPLAREVFESISSAEVLQQSEVVGLFCREEEQGQVYPQNGQASAVLDALRLFFQKKGGEELYGAAVVQVKQQKSGYLLSLEDGRTFLASRLILVQGGKASPQISSDQGISLAHQLGHSQTALLPALMRVIVPQARVRTLKGMRCSGVVRFLVDGHTVRQGEGEIQSTECGLSGVCVLQLSWLAAEYVASKTVQGKPCKNVQPAMDLLPESPFQEVCELLRCLVPTYPQLVARDLLFGVPPKRMGQQMMASALSEKAGEPAGSLGGSWVKTVAGVLKGWAFPVTGTLPWQYAQVTAGGIPLAELFLPSTESRISSGVYLAGEQLNVDGDCGDFNLYQAWVSGMVAGRSAAMAAKEGNIRFEFQRSPCPFS